MQTLLDQSSDFQRKEKPWFELIEQILDDLDIACTNSSNLVGLYQPRVDSHLKSVNASNVFEYASTQYPVEMMGKTEADFLDMVDAFYFKKTLQVDGINYKQILYKVDLVKKDRPEALKNSRFFHNAMYDIMNRELITMRAILEREKRKTSENLRLLTQSYEDKISQIRDELIEANNEKIEFKQLSTRLECAASSWVDTVPVVVNIKVGSQIETVLMDVRAKAHIDLLNSIIQKLSSKLINLSRNNKTSKIEIENLNGKLNLYQSTLRKLVRKLPKA